MRTGSERARKRKWEAVLACADSIKMLLRKHAVQVESGCVLWTGKIRKANGYGTLKVWYKGKYVYMDVHQVSLMIQIGGPIPIGFEAGHTCDNRACIRHVEKQSYEDNMARQRGKEKRTDSDCPF